MTMTTRLTTSATIWTDDLSEDDDDQDGVRWSAWRLFERAANGAAV